MIFWEFDTGLTSRRTRGATVHLFSSDHRLARCGGSSSFIQKLIATLFRWTDEVTVVSYIKLQCKRLKCEVIWSAELVGKTVAKPLCRGFDVVDGWAKRASVIRGFEPVDFYLVRLDLGTWQLLYDCLKWISHKLRAYTEVKVKSLVPLPLAKFKGGRSFQSFSTKERWCLASKPGYRWRGASYCFLIWCLQKVL